MGNAVVAAGNTRLMHELGVFCPNPASLKSKRARLVRKPQIVVASNGEILGIIAVADT